VVFNLSIGDTRATGCITQQLRHICVTYQNSILLPVTLRTALTRFETNQIIPEGKQAVADTLPRHYEITLCSNRNAMEYVMSNSIFVYCKTPAYST
jgi:hypothetical protein